MLANRPMTTNPLFEAIIDMAVFFAISTDDLVDPSEAVNQLEQLGATMSRLNKNEQRQFVEYCAWFSAEAAINGADPSRVNAIAELPDNMGLGEE